MVPTATPAGMPRRCDTSRCRGRKHTPFGMHLVVARVGGLDRQKDAGSDMQGQHRRADAARGESREQGSGDMETRSRRRHRPLGTDKGFDAADFCRGAAHVEYAAVCGAKYQPTTLGDRQANDPSPRLRDEPASARGLRRRSAYSRPARPAQDKTPGPAQGRLGLHFRHGRRQLSASPQAG